MVRRSSRLSSGSKGSNFGNLYLCRRPGVLVPPAAVGTYEVTVLPFKCFDAIDQMVMAEFTFPDHEKPFKESYKEYPPIP